MTEPRQVRIVVHEGMVTSTIAAHEGELLIEALRRFGKGMSAPCGGRGTCRKCGVEVIGEGHRLSCQYRVARAVEVSLPETSHAQILHESRAPAEALVNDAGIREVATPAGRECRFRDLRIASAPPPRLCGVAVDVGTTTVVVYLADLRTYEVIDVGSFINPQVQYGHDVVSRIQHAMTQPTGLADLRQAIVGRIGREIEALCGRNGLQPDWLLKMTVVGNPTMMHIFCGVDPSSIAIAPYTPAFTGRKCLRAGEVGLPMAPEAVVLVLPGVSGYVGADITAGLATTPIAQEAETALFIDIGTNGEMAIGRQGRVFCCATAAGPAFEGANIACGVGGVQGAIATYVDGRYGTIGDQRPVGICGSGLIDIAAHIIDKGIADRSGYMEQDFVVAPAAAAATGVDIVLTPQDVRQVQLAKAAIAGGIQVMLAESGLSFEDLQALYIGGAFGNFMNIDSAAAIGLIPPQLRDKVVTTGNVAGRGALSALLSVQFDDRVDRIAQEATYVELSTHPAFMDHYVAAMGF